jgi:hypothetical protein
MLNVKDIALVDPACTPASSLSHLKREFHSDGRTLLRQLKAQPVLRTVDSQVRGKLVAGIDAQVLVQGHASSIDR